MQQGLVDIAAAPAHSRRWLIGLYSGSVVLYWGSLYLYVPTLPTYFQSKTDSLTMVGVIISMYGLSQAVVRLPLGIAADSWGRRKPFILAGFALASIGALVMGLSKGAAGLLIGRSITGLAAASWVPLIVVFSSLFPPQEAVRATTILTFIGSASRVVATAITGSLNAMGGYSLAFFSAAAVALLGLLLVLPVKEQGSPPKRPDVHAIRALILRRDVLLPAVLSAITQYANWATTLGFIPVLAKQMGGTDFTLSFLVSLNTGVITLVNLMAVALLKRMGTRRLALMSFLLLTAGIGGAALVTNLPGLFFFQLIIGISTGISYPVLMGMSIEYVAGPERATAMGLHQSVYAIGMFAGPFLSGVLADALGIRLMFGLTAAFALIAGLLGVRSLAGRPSSQQTST
jgi:MFS family permease